MIRSAFYHLGCIEAGCFPISVHCDPLKIRLARRSRRVVPVRSRTLLPLLRVGEVRTGVRTCLPLVRHASCLARSSRPRAACQATPGDVCSSTFKDQRLSAPPGSEPRPLRALTEGSPRCRFRSKFCRVTDAASRIASRVSEGQGFVEVRPLQTLSLPIARS